MDLHKLEVFLTVADYLNFTRAGEDLGYTQSGITHMMKSLEKEIGFPLFIKNHHGVTLTHEAENLLPSIRSLLAANESLNQEISFLKGAKKGTIKVGTYISAAIHWLPKIIADFQKENPDIHFEISEGDEGQLANWLSDRKVDIGFTSYHENQNYTFFPVLKDPMLVVFPKGHPFSQFTEIPLDWLDNEPFMVSEYTYANDVHRLLKKHNIKPDIKYTLSNDFSILSLVEHNLGITILPAMILRNRTGNFETRPLKPNLYRQMGMAITSEDNLSPAAKIFIRYAKDYLFD